MKILKSVKQISTMDGERYLKFESTIGTFTLGLVSWFKELARVEFALSYLEEFYDHDYFEVWQQGIRIEELPSTDSSFFDLPLDELTLQLISEMIRHTKILASVKYPSMLGLYDKEEYKILKSMKRVKPESDHLSIESNVGHFLLNESFLIDLISNPENATTVVGKGHALECPEFLSELVDYYTAVGSDGIECCQLESEHKPRKPSVQAFDCDDCTFYIDTMLLTDYLKECIQAVRKSNETWKHMRLVNNLLASTCLQINTKGEPTVLIETLKLNIKDIANRVKF